MKQAKFWKSPKPFHGGSQSVGKRKAARAIVTKQPMHVVFRSSRARGEWNFLRHSKRIERAIHRLAKKYFVQVRLYQNVGNHLHIAVQAAKRKEFQNFLREVPQAIAFLVTKTRKGNPIGRFWDALVYTRVVHWGSDWAGIRVYFEKNRLEAGGAPREAIDRIYREVKAAWS